MKFNLDVHAMRDLGLRDARDQDIFRAAREARAVVVTKDIDFVLLLERLGPPPQVIWVRCGNTSNARLKRLLDGALPNAMTLLQKGEALVEIRDAW